MSILKANNLEIAYDDKVIVKSLNLEIKKGEIVSIIGPNGCGKSTTLKALCRCKSISSGSIELYGKKIDTINTKEIAKKIAILPQMRNVPGDITVKSLVSLGRYPHLGFRGKLKKQDMEIIKLAMEKTNITSMENRKIRDLSGGESQRAWIAMTLAQNTEILILDEPTTYLDISHQLEVLELVKELNKTLGLTIIMVLHDLNLAVRYSHKIIAMKNGKVVSEGIPSEILTEDLIHDIFGISSRVTYDKDNNCPYFIALKAHKKINKNRY